MRIQISLLKEISLTVSDENYILELGEYTLSPYGHINMFKALTKDIYFQTFPIICVQDLKNNMLPDSVLDDICNIRLLARPEYIFTATVEKTNERYFLTRLIQILPKEKNICKFLPGASLGDVCVYGSYQVLI